MNRPDYDAYLESEAWKIRRQWKLEQADFRCQLCNAGGVLHVHHRTYERVGNERQNDLIVLCGNCHAKFHDRLAPEPEPAAPVRPHHHHYAMSFVRWWDVNQYQLERLPSGSTEWEANFDWYVLPLPLTPEERVEMRELAFAEIQSRAAQQ